MVFLLLVRHCSVHSLIDDTGYCVIQRTISYRKLYSHTHTLNQQRQRWCMHSLCSEEPSLCFKHATLKKSQSLFNSNMCRKTRMQFLIFILVWLKQKLNGLHSRSCIIWKANVCFFWEKAFQSSSSTHQQSWQASSWSHLKWHCLVKTKRI